MSTPRIGLGLPSAIPGAPDCAVLEWAALAAMLVEMRRAWAGELTGASGPLPPTPPGRPRLLFGGMAPRSFARMAALGEGWVAPALGLDVLPGGVQSARRAWSDAGRGRSPRLVTGRYVSLGPDADTAADRYIHHYYGDAYFSAVRPSVATTHVQLQRQLDQLGEAGFHDIVLYPCTPDPEQGRRIASALDVTGEWLTSVGG